MTSGSTSSTSAAPAGEVDPPDAAAPVRTAPDVEVAGCTGADGPDAPGGSGSPGGTPCGPRVGRPRSLAADTAIRAGTALTA